MCYIWLLINVNKYIGLHCRLVVVTLTTQASLVDVSDTNVLYLAGFDASTPEVIRSFAVGDLDSVPAG